MESDKVIDDFIKQQHSRKTKWGLQRLKTKGNKPPLLQVDDPFGMIALFGFLRHEAKMSGGQVFCRGEFKEHKTLSPALFRDKNGDIYTDEKIIENLIAAGNDFKSSIHKELGKIWRRFEVEEIMAIFQHYGFRTSWIDLVDSVHVALWFALNRQQKKYNGSVEYTARKAKKSGQFGWVHFIQTSSQSVNGYYLITQDLREHLPLSLRPHAQQGWAATVIKPEYWNNRGCILDPFIVASVRIDRGLKVWAPCRKRFPQDFLFPSPGDDHTYSVLSEREDKLSAMAGRIEDDKRLSANALGRVAIYKTASKSKPSTIGW